MEQLIDMAEKYSGYTITIVGAISLIVAGSVGFYYKRIKPRLKSFDRWALLVNGRDAISLPEAEEIIIDPELPNALIRLSDLEKSDSKIIMNLKLLEGSLKEILHEVKPNNGTSLRDAVNRTEERVERTEEKLDAHLKEYPSQVISELGHRLSTNEEGKDETL